MNNIQTLISNTLKEFDYNIDSEVIKDNECNFIIDDFKVFIRIPNINKKHIQVSFNDFTVDPAYSAMFILVLKEISRIKIEVCECFNINNDTILFGDEAKNYSYELLRTEFKKEFQQELYLKQIEVDNCYNA